jgi:N6-L-threonylcarbamoyladenine synthase
MRILGIETTCDETGIAVVEDGRRILVNRVLSQVPLHERFGGVVPEIASRAHVESITWTLEAALREAGLAFTGSRPDLDGIAVAYRPGLVGSLLIGVTAAKCLAWAWNLPLVGVDHIHAHIYAGAMTACRPENAGFLEEEEIFPAISLVVSGGHTALYLSRGWTDHALLGSTTDDAAGEAFDKVAAILKLGYPGGPAISRAAEGGNPRACPFPQTLFDADSLDFSFSGIKTAVLYHVKGQNAGREAPLREGISIADVAASFEETVVSILIKKIARALEHEQVHAAIVGGGVAANSRLRLGLDRLARKEGYRIFYPPPPLCTDNGAMIAGLGYRLLRQGRRDSLSLDADPVAVR